MPDFRQFINLMRQNRLFTLIYVLGTAMAIATTTVFAVLVYTRLAPVYPETNRLHTGHITHAMVSSPGRMSQSYLSHGAVRQFIYPLKSVRAATAYWDEGDTGLSADAGSPLMHFRTKMVDPQFFTVFPYSFIQGAPFSQEDFEAGMRRVVLSRSAAERLLGSADSAIGRDVLIDDVPFRITGVVRDAPSIMDFSYADVFLPYTVSPDFANEWSVMLGQFTASVVSDDLDAVRAELADMVARHNSTLGEDEEFTLCSQPVPHYFMAIEDDWMADDFSPWALARKFALVLIVLLLVPALNLSGMISGRMDSRQSELGVRKSFGATRGALLRQVLWENLYLTLAGGVVGLALTWILLYGCADWIFNLMGDVWGRPAHASLTPEVPFSPAVFGFAFLFCIVLNVLSALVPAWLSLRRPIVNSLKERE